jgi:carboxypeptidase Q
MKRVILLVVVLSWVAGAQMLQAGDHRALLDRLVETGLRDGKAYRMLSDLTRRAPHRLSGSPGADTAVQVMLGLLSGIGCDSVWTEPCMVPHWVRGGVEEVRVIRSGKPARLLSLTCCALGGSVGTPKGGITGEVLEVHSLAEAKSLGAKAKGKILFYNRPMDPGNLDTFDAYGGAVDQRSRGAIEGARVGAVAVLVRSMTLAHDDVPHTGVMSYAGGVEKIPAAALSTKAADRLSQLLKHDPKTRVRMDLSCRTLPDRPSVNVIGEIRGKKRPEEIVLVGGHLDCWDKGMGAHDDGSGCVQALEVLRLVKVLHLEPSRTIRAVLFMNEENGSRGGAAYAENPARKKEHHIAAIESDRGGFAPRGFTVQGDSAGLAKILTWKPLFEILGAGRIVRGGSGSDVGHIQERGCSDIGLDVDDERYFDYHHSDNDTIDKVHPRELELGAIASAFLCLLISEEGMAR